jgi:hypothetical protein
LSEDVQHSHEREAVDVPPVDRRVAIEASDGVERWGRGYVSWPQHLNLPRSIGDHEGHFDRADVVAYHEQRPVRGESLTAGDLEAQEQREKHPTEAAQQAAL